jgi:hypothetical protein
MQAAIAAMNMTLEIIAYKFSLKANKNDAKIPFENKEYQIEEENYYSVRRFGNFRLLYDQIAAI